MARLPRLTLPGLPHHILLRGNDRQPIVRTDEDRQQLLDLLASHAADHRVALHAYVLMDNHLHLLATPEDERLPLWMQAVGRRYVRFFNDRHGRSGTLWEGRYRSTVLQPERYLLACMAWMDLNPVRAGLVARPADHAWSSHRHYVGLRHDRVVAPHALYWALGNTPFAREAAYAELVREGPPAGIQQQLLAAVRGGWALGDEAFVAGLQKLTPRRVTMRPAGRPRRLSSQES